MRSYFRRDVTPEVGRYSYQITKFTGIEALAEESSLPLSWASYAYNVTVKNGVLTQGIGIEYARINGRLLPAGISVGSRPVKAAVFRRMDSTTKERDDILVALMNNRKIYYAHFADNEFSDSGIKFANHDVTLLNYHYNGTDCMLIIGAEGKMYVFDGTNFTAVTNPPKLTHACIHNERVYGTVSEGANRVYFSDDLNPTNWNVSLTEGGYISFPDEGGKVTGVISFKSNLYIIREYAIHKLVAYADQSDYVLTRVFSTNNMIYAKSAAICNNAITFLAEDGFYSFDGYACKKILKGIEPLIESKQNSHACFFDNKYFVAVKLKRDDAVVGDENLDFKNNGLIIHDFDSGETGIFRGADIGSFLPLSIESENKLIVIFDNLYRGYNFGEITESGKFFNQKLPKLWRSPYTDFTSLNKDKVLKKIFIDVDSPVKLTAKLDKNYTIKLDGSDGAQMIPVNKRADKVGIEISTDEDAFKVKGMLLEFDFIRRSNYERDNG